MEAAVGVFVQSNQPKIDNTYVASCRKQQQTQNKSHTFHIFCKQMLLVTTETQRDGQLTVCFRADAPYTQGGAAHYKHHI